MDGVETLDVLTRSPVRIQVLKRLVDEGSTTASDLSQHMAASRRTISRTLKLLEERGIAESEASTYRPTKYGALLAPELADLLGSIEPLRERAAFLEAFPVDAFDVDFAQIEGTAVTRREARPHGPVSTVIDALAAATTIQVIAPIASPLYVRPFANRVCEGATIDAVVSRAAYDEFCAQLHTGIRIAATLTDVSLSVAHDIDYGFICCDDRLILGAYDGGELRATFETSDSVALEAASKTFQRIQREAEPVIGSKVGRVDTP